MKWRYHYRDAFIPAVYNHTWGLRGGMYVLSNPYHSLVVRTDRYINE